MPASSPLMTLLGRGDAMPHADMAGSTADPHAYRLSRNSALANLSSMLGHAAAAEIPIIEYVGIRGADDPDRIQLLDPYRGAVEIDQAEVDAMCASPIGAVTVECPGLAQSGVPEEDVAIRLQRHVNGLQDGANAQLPAAYTIDMFTSNEFGVHAVGVALQKMQQGVPIGRDPFEPAPRTHRAMQSSSDPKVWQSAMVCIRPAEEHPTGSHASVAIAHPERAVVISDAADLRREVENMVKGADTKELPGALILVARSLTPGHNSFREAFMLQGLSLHGTEDGERVLGPTTFDDAMRALNRIPRLARTLGQPDVLFEAIPASGWFACADREPQMNGEMKPSWDFQVNPHTSSAGFGFAAGHALVKPHPVSGKMTIRHAAADHYNPNVFRMAEIITPNLRNRAQHHVEDIENKALQIRLSKSDQEFRVASTMATSLNSEISAPGISAAQAIQIGGQLDEAEDRVDSAAALASIRLDRLQDAVRQRMA